MPRPTPSAASLPTARPTTFPTPAPTLGAPRNDKRCGPRFGGAVCGGKGWRFCTERKGWCGNTKKHQNAQPGTTYDWKKPPAVDQEEKEGGGGGVEEGEDEDEEDSAADEMAEEDVEVAAAVLQQEQQKQEQEQQTAPTLGAPRNDKRCGPRFGGAVCGGKGWRFCNERK